MIALTEYCGVVERIDITWEVLIYEGLSIGVAEREVSSLTPLLLGCLSGWMALSFEKGNHCRGESIAQFLIYYT